jgi:UDP-glucose 4-epimerase
LEKILVLGGGGFIGSAICDTLLRSGHELRVFERPRVSPYRTFSSNERVEWINGDLQSAVDVKEALRGVVAVVHLVSTTLPKGSNDDAAFDVQSNVLGTLQLLNLMVSEGIRRVVFISSGGTVYGIPIELPIREDHPTNPLVSYGVTKLMIEKYLSIFEGTHGIRSVVLRVANPYGPRQRIETAQGAVGVFISKAIRDESIEIWGDGSVVRDYVYVSDVADAFRSALELSEFRSGVFNIGSGEGHSLLDVISLIEQVLRRPIRVDFLPARNFDIPKNVLDIALAKSELKWSPRVKLGDGIADTIHWFQTALHNA